MAIYLGNNVGLKIATIDISSFVTSLTLTQNFDEVEVTTMGNSSHVFSKGLENSTLQVSFLNDFAASSIRVIAVRQRATSQPRANFACALAPKSAK